MNKTEGSKEYAGSISDSITRTYQLRRESSSDEEEKNLKRASCNGRLFALVEDEKEQDIITIAKVSCIQSLPLSGEGKEIIQLPLSQHPSTLKPYVSEFPKDMQSSDGKTRKKANSTGTRTKSIEGVDGLVNTKKKKRHSAETITSKQSDPIKPSNMIIPCPNVSLGLMLKISCSLSLRSIHVCLNYITGFNQYSLQWIKDYGLAVLKDKNLRDKQREACEKILEVISRAVSVKISHFSDSLGREVSLQDLINRLIKSCGESELQVFTDFVEKMTHFSKKAARINENIQLETKGDLSKPCMLTPSLEELKKPECFSSTLLTRLSSLLTSSESKNEGALHPITLICTYRRWVSTELLFFQILEKLSLPQESMPMAQKLEIMKLIRIWLTCGLNFKEEKHIQVDIAFKSILSKTKSVKDEQFLSAAEEIFQILQSPIKESQIARVKPGEINFDTFIGNLWGNKDQNKVNLKLIASELHKCFIHLFLSFEAHELIYGLDKKDSPQKVPSLWNLVSFFNKLTFFTRTCILKPSEELGSIEEVNEKVKAPILEKVRERYVFFIDLAYEMIKLRNFSASIAILLGVSCPAISKLFLKKAVTQNSEGRSITKEIRSSKKIHKSSMLKLEEMNAIYSPVKSHASLRQEYVKTNAAYIPYLGLTLSDITHIEDGNEDIVKDCSFPINLEKLELFTNSLLPVIEAQQRLFFELQCEGPCIKMETDLLSYLNSCEFYEENKLYLLSGKLKRKA